MFLEHFMKIRVKIGSKNFLTWNVPRVERSWRILQFEFLSRNETLSADTYVFRNWNVLPMEAKTRGKTFCEYQLQECGFISRSNNKT